MVGRTPNTTWEGQGLPGGGISQVECQRTGKWNGDGGTEGTEAMSTEGRNSLRSHRTMSSKGCWSRGGEGGRGGG